MRPNAPHNRPSTTVVGLDSPGRRKIYEVRALYNDVTFLDEFLTPEFVDDQKDLMAALDEAVRSAMESFMGKGTSARVKKSL